MGRKYGGGLRPLLGELAASPSNTKSPGLRPTFTTSGILTHPAVFGHNINGPKIGEGAPPPFWGGGLGIRRTQSRLG